MITNGKFGNVEIKCLSNAQIPESVQRLGWTLDRTIDVGTDNKLYLLEGALLSDLGYIKGDEYIVFSENNDEDDEPFYAFYSISIPQNCEPDFAIARGILDTLWQISLDAYDLGYKDGSEQ